MDEKLILAPDEGEFVWLMALGGVRFMVSGYGQTITLPW